MPSMMRRAPFPCTAASLVGPAIVACSSFSAAPPPADAGVDAATSEEASVLPVDDAGDATAPVDSGDSFDVAYPECLGWTSSGKATIRSVTNVATGEGACRVCAPDRVGSPYLSKSFEPAPGKYQISATALPFGNLPDTTTYGVGFRTVPTDGSATDTVPASPMPIKLSQTVTISSGTAALEATIELAAQQGGCVDLRDLTIVGPTH